MNWQNELRDAIKTCEDASSFFDYPFQKTSYPLFIPKSFAKKILAMGPESPLWKQFLPTQLENHKEYQTNGLYDPIGDMSHSKGNQIIHRYRNRILFTPTTVCPIACRYCFRKNELAAHDKIFDPHFSETINYISMHPEINEIIFSGGDPLVLSDEKIDFYLDEFSKLGNIKYIRFHSRVPIILPSRINETFLALLNKYKPKFQNLVLMIHVNHSLEIDDEIEDTFQRLLKNRIDLFSQTVLLKDINDNTETLKNLFLKLSDLHIRPYYLHHPDRVLGGMHFYINLEEGRRLFAPLRDLVPGWALPQYIIDIPGGEGKTSAFNPETFSFSGNLINRKGDIVRI